MATVIKPYKVIQLSESSFIRFDFDGRLFRAAYYKPSQDKNSQQKLARATCKADSVIGMLCGLFNVIAPNETVRGVERYIRATEWGSDLP